MTGHSAARKMKLQDQAQLRFGKDQARPAESDLVGGLVVAFEPVVSEQVAPGRVLREWFSLAAREGLGGLAHNYQLSSRLQASLPFQCNQAFCCHRHLEPKCRTKAKPRQLPAEEEVSVSCNLKLA